MNPGAFRLWGDRVQVVQQPRLARGDLRGDGVGPAAAAPRVRSGRRAFPRRAVFHRGGAGDGGGASSRRFGVAGGHEQGDELQRAQQVGRLLRRQRGTALARRVHLDVVVQVAFESKILNQEIRKPGNQEIGSTVETRRFEAMDG